MKSRRVVFLVYDGIQSLDLVGPFEVFAMANWEQRSKQPSAPAPYALEVVAASCGPVHASSGMAMLAQRPYSSVTGSIDTLMIAGGEVYDAARDERLLRWVRRTAPKVRRLASVCSGAFILAQAGLLDGRRATTHWSAVSFLAAYPKITVEADAIFVRDGNVYTSAGVTTGIDLALALVEEDLGHAMALAIARRLVVFLKRPGGQSQFSGHLAAQASDNRLLKGVPEWIVDNLAADLAVEKLAARAGMSPRNFARVFYREMEVTPAKFVEKARIDAARRLLEDSSCSLEEVATQCGFTSGEQMRRTFHRHLRIVPLDYRRRFQQRPTPVVLSGGKTNDSAISKEARRRALPGLRAARRVRAA